MKLRRTIIYEGSRRWIENTLAHSAVSPRKPLEFPQGKILEESREVLDNALDYNPDADAVLDAILVSRVGWCTMGHPIGQRGCARCEGTIK